MKNLYYVKNIINIINKYSFISTVNRGIYLLDKSFYIEIGKNIKDMIINKRKMLKTILSTLMIILLISAIGILKEFNINITFIIFFIPPGLMSISWTQKVKLFYAALLANNSH